VSELVPNTKLKRKEEGYLRREESVTTWERVVDCLQGGLEWGKRHIVKSRKGRDGGGKLC